VKVFVSYSSTDRVLVASIVNDLEAAGYEVWFDQELSGGQTWWDVILDNVRRADVVVFAVTEAAVASQACRAEAAYAAALGKTVIPLRLTDVEPDAAPSALQQVQWIDYRTPDRTAAFAVVRAVNNATTRPLPDPMPNPPPVPLSYLADLVDKVDSPGALTLENQLAIVFAFRQLVAQERNPVKVADLLTRFRQRDDLLAKVAVDIDVLLGQLAPVAPTAPAAPKEPTTASTPTTGTGTRTTATTETAGSPPARPPVIPATPPPARDRDGRPPNRRPLWIALGVLAAIIVVGIAIVASRGGGSTAASGSATSSSGSTPTTAKSDIQYVCAGGPALCVRIDSVSLDGDSFLVSWSAIGFQPDVGSNHAHFFWDTTKVGAAGTNAASFGFTPGQWELTSAQPFRSSLPFLRPSARPAGATRLCATVGNHDHGVVDPTNFSCAPLPG
jgi:hypothetical protein